MENEDMLKRFLLGAVNENERDQIQDELFSGEGLFEEMLLVEDQLTDEYLYGKLTGEDLVRFERYFLVAPQRREKLRVAEALQQHALLRKSIPVAKPSRFVWSLPSALGWRVAAVSLALAVVAGLMAWILWTNLKLRNEFDGINAKLEHALEERRSGTLSEEQRKQIEVEQRRNNDLLAKLDALSIQTGTLDKQIASLRSENKTLQLRVAKLTDYAARQGSRSTPALVAILEPGQPRGTDQSNVVRIEPDMKEIELHLMLEEEPQTTYFAELIDANGKSIRLKRGLSVTNVNGGKAVAVRFQTDLLKRGSYILKLSSAHRIGPRRVSLRRVASYQFKVE